MSKLKKFTDRTFATASDAADAADAFFKDRGYNLEDKESLDLASNRGLTVGETYTITSFDREVFKGNNDKEYPVDWGNVGKGKRVSIKGFIINPNSGSGDTDDKHKNNLTEAGKAILNGDDERMYNRKKYASDYLFVKALYEKPSAFPFRYEGYYWNYYEVGSTPVWQKVHLYSFLASKKK